MQKLLRKFIAFSLMFVGIDSQEPSFMWYVWCFNTNIKTTTILDGFKYKAFHLLYI